MATQDVWTHNVAAIIIAQVPLQSMDSAVVLVNAYLSDIGGWNVALVEQDAADAITEEQYNAIYDLNVRTTITLDLQMAAKLTAELSIDDALDAMKNQINAFLFQINNTKFPVRLRTVNTYSRVAGRSTLGLSGSPDQTTTQPVRQAIAADLDSPNKLFDYKANGLLYARDTYGLDDSWNVTSVYTEPNGPIVLQIKKYASTTYELLDGTSTTVYVITISPGTYGIVSGIILN